MTKTTTDSTGGSDHWNEVYSKKRPDQVSWFEQVPQQSLQWIEESGVPKDAPIIDVGGGASTLVDELVMRGYRDVTVLDISEEVLRQVAQRLAGHRDSVKLITHDVTTFLPARPYKLWHDRAVFHFLIDPEHRRKYRDSLLRATAAGSHILVATFGPEGPMRCSGLDTARYDANQLAAEFGTAFRLVRSSLEFHATPAGAQQQFLHTHFTRV